MVIVIKIIWRYFEDYMFNICIIFIFDNVKIYDLKIIKKFEKNIMFIVYIFNSGIYSLIFW